ncbi:hypothetical protein [Notoacmeibacter marinus]|uniref:hypothetical protein n=1 Tax=Notoacmeibacter marinus TaxID=1876515 RepID=UPI00117A8966|nr:hypothetical protein [Notoacmeibacter marinus]
MEFDAGVGRISGQGREQYDKTRRAVLDAAAGRSCVLEDIVAGSTRIVVAIPRIVLVDKANGVVGFKTYRELADLVQNAHNVAAKR